MESSIKISRGQLANVFKEYGTIAALLADQANQSSNRLYKVIDASADPNLTFPVGETKKHAYYEYKETPNSDIGDYDLIGAPYSGVDMPPFDPTDYDLDEFNNASADPYVRVSEVPAAIVPKEEEIVGTRHDETSGGGTVSLDWDSFKVYTIGISGSTELSDWNLPTGYDTKVMEVLVWGNASLTLPSYWTPFPNNDDYDGSMLNHIVITCIDGGTPKKVFYSLQNIILNE